MQEFVNKSKKVNVTHRKFDYTKTKLYPKTVDLKYFIC